MENIDRDLLLNFYFKDGYYFFIPDRLLVDEANDVLKKLSDKPECVLKEEDRCISSILS